MVGAAPNRAGDGALLGASGRRLARLLGFAAAEYARLDRRNLLGYYPGRRGPKGDALGEHNP